MRLCHCCLASGLIILSSQVYACPECDWFGDWPRTVEEIRRVADTLDNGEKG